MTHHALIPILLATLLGLVCAGASAEPRATQVSNWQTTIRVEVPLPSDSGAPAQKARPGRAVTTGALPPPPSAASTAPPPGTVAADPKPHRLEGIASFYWQEQRTASGERFDKMAMTAAHPTLPFDSRVRVTNLANGRSVVVRINDRGPFKPGRVIDLSWAAAGEIDMRSKGLVKVKIDVVEIGPDRQRRVSRR